MHAVNGKKQSRHHGNGAVEEPLGHIKQRQDAERSGDETQRLARGDGIAEEPGEDAGRIEMQRQPGSDLNPNRRGGPLRAQDRPLIGIARLIVGEHANSQADGCRERQNQQQVEIALHEAAHPLSARRVELGRSATEGPQPVTAEVPQQHDGGGRHLCEQVMQMRADERVHDEGIHRQTDAAQDCESDGGDRMGLSAAKRVVVVCRDN